MTFSDIIARWPSLQDLAGDLGLPVKNVRRWQDIGSIPAEWFVAVQAAAKARGFADVNIRSLSEAAHARRLSKVSPEAANDATPKSEAARASSPNAARVPPPPSVRCGSGWGVRPTLSPAGQPLSLSVVPDDRP